MAVRSLRFVLTGEDKSASRSLDRVGKQADKTKHKLASMAGGFAGGALAGAFTGFFKGGLDGMKAAQEVSAQTATVIKSMGNAAGRSQAQIEGLADRIEKMSGLEAENIQAGQNMLLTFSNIRGQNFDRATMAMADMAARMGGDAVGAATMLGKALNDPAKGISALTRVGVSFSKAEQQQIKTMAAHGDMAGAQVIILKSLEAQFGGSAKAAGKTMTGQMKILQARYGDVQEEVVGKLLPALIKLAEGLSSVITFVQKNQKWLLPLIATLGAFVATLMTVSKAIAVYNAASAAMGFSTTLALGPVGLIIAAIAALGVGLVIAYKKSQTFRTIVQASFAGVLVGVQTLLRGFDFFARASDALFGTHMHDKIRGVIADIDQLIARITGIPNPIPIEIRAKLTGEAAAKAILTGNAGTGQQPGDLGEFLNRQTGANVPAPRVPPHGAAPVGFMMRSDGSRSSLGFTPAAHADRGGMHFVPTARLDATQVIDRRTPVVNVYVGGKKVAAQVTQTQRVTTTRGSIPSFGY